MHESKQRQQSRCAKLQGQIPSSYLRFTDLVGECGSVGIKPVSKFAISPRGILPIRSWQTFVLDRQVFP
jgi:hypothetical protein